ncbi:hypothetical protein [Cardiobacterium hominis]|jgi:hypothetical protein|uniref:hypothetical protein n=1 Tax=Cardiobacterium hominis TaxID=2718 RepID=UPI000A7B5902|nr:hypothetical protein [Cardiobacterium hominis]
MISRDLLRYAYEQVADKLNKKNIIPEQEDKIRLCGNILSSMLNSGNSWEDLCEFCYNDKNILTKMNTELSRPFIGHNEFNESLLVSSLHFLREALLKERRDNTNRNIKDDLWDVFFYDNLDFSEPRKNEIKYLLNEFSIDVINNYLGSKDLSPFLRYEELSKNIEFKISQIEYIKDDIDRLERSLTNIKNAFNFVGLSKGFENILIKKERSRNITFAGLVAFSIILLFPISYECYYFFTTKSDINWVGFLPVIGLELILIYLFRVILSNYFSLQTQIMQLELRQTLCQFIQSYVEYAQEIKNLDKEALEKFENLIFSGIVLNSDKIPGTFDGVESLASLVQALKGDKS